ncbi:2'-5' RNA ligase family protein [Paenibacillus sp. LHD-117]|uniref:2'-5' RNA ligase family protein n=1 Tax=Paenibacillus sp. LHD-117 TaxID=3071412 RepID=UPI0027E18D8D|nr:2'-5' RNA ligase family protein [Paenibacillus sp. LHD-117]MDQ6420903.1 2'-5' RNA ligase family protein [Paenibacillus sp. LHD-117]
MLYGIAVFPEKAVQDEANSWRIRHDPHYCNIAAHMTIREAEDWDETKLRLAVEQLEKTAATLSPFKVKFNRVSTFFPVTPTLYFALEDPSPVAMLHEAVCSGPLEQTLPNYVYTPHITIGRNMPPDELHDLYGNLRMKEIRLATLIDRIHLLYQTEQGGWTAYQSFQLGNG